MASLRLVGALKALLGHWRIKLRRLGPRALKSKEKSACPKSLHNIHLTRSRYSVLSLCMKSASGTLGIEAGTSQTFTNKLTWNAVAAPLDFFENSDFSHICRVFLSRELETRKQLELSPPSLLTHLRIISDLLP